MFVELHLLQNFAPSNLNRDDTGSPKDCEFGGVRRARISSQCLKRAMREAFRDEGLLPQHNLAERTKLGVSAVATRLASKGHPELEARAVAEAAVRGAGLGVKEGKTEYLLFLGEREMSGIAEVCHEHWTELAALATAAHADEPASENGTAPTTRRSGKDAKRDARAALSPEVVAALTAQLHGGQAADLALFGRMIADLKHLSIDAASQVAHALSTHKVSVEFDFFTAVDDLQPKEESGAGMMGTVEFNSACFYRYANIDVAQLTRNLGGDQRLAAETVRAFTQAAVAAVPSGKQNSMAAHNPPSFVMAVVRDRGLWSLANAFVQPVRPSQSADLVAGSIIALDKQWGKLTHMYGEGGIRGTWVLHAEDGVAMPHLEQRRVGSLDALVQQVVAAVSAGAGVVA